MSPKTSSRRSLKQVVTCVAIGGALIGCSAASNSDATTPINSAGGTGGAAGAIGSTTGGSASTQGGASNAAGGNGGAGAAAGGAPSSAGAAGASAGGTNAGGAGAAGTNGGTSGAGTSSGGTSSTAGGAGSAGSAGSGTLPSVTVYIAGDSTVSQYVLDPKDPKSWAGWGQMLGAYYQPRATVIDDAVGGRTARRFIQEGTLDAILKVIKPGDYLLVQFGTNDSNTDKTVTYTVAGVTYPYYAAAETDFKTYLQQYISGAQGKQAIPVLVTPPPRNSAYCNGGRSLSDYGQAMVELGKADSVAVVDLGAKTHDYLSAICPKPTAGAQEMFFKIKPDGTIDGTHFQENGARIMAGFVADGVGEAKLGLAAYRKP